MHANATKSNELFPWSCWVHIHFSWLLTSCLTPTIRHCHTASTWLKYVVVHAWPDVEVGLALSFVGLLLVLTYSHVRYVLPCCNAWQAFFLAPSMTQYVGSSLSMPVQEWPLMIVDKCWSIQSSLRWHLNYLHSFQYTEIPIFDCMLHMATINYKGCWGQICLVY